MSETIKLEIELEYDNELLHGNDPAAVSWFMNDVLKGSGLILHDNDIGDAIGKVRVIRVEEKNNLIEELEKIVREVPLQGIYEDDAEGTYPERWRRLEKLVKDKQIFIISQPNK